jgi:hypothetical protein
MAVNDTEREQASWVFGLTGGELEAAAWDYVHESWGLSTDPDNEHMPRDDKGRTADAEHIRAGGFRYWYEGAPEYTGRDHAERGSTSDAQGRDVRTAVVCALYGMPPAILWDTKDGARWERVAFYQSGGETECPGQHEEENRVTTDHIGKADPNDANTTCVLCDEEIGEPHGYIYLGDGWGEAVYVRMTPALEFEIIDHGCDGEQYFQGCGVSFTRYTDVITGIGESAREAAEDALSQMDTGPVYPPPALENAVRELSNAPSFDAGDPEISPEWHHYVSIRWRIVKH